MVTKPTKKDIELGILRRFKNAYPEFPDGEILDADRPDFIVQGNQRVGIEVAQVFQDSDMKGFSKLKLLEELHDRVGHGLVKKLGEYTDKHFALGIHFNDGVILERKQVNKIIMDCLSECLNFVLNVTKGDTTIQNSFFSLPPEIVSIWIDVRPSMKRSFYNRAAGGGVANLEFKHIEHTLLKHEERMNTYAPCDEYWFIIGEGNWYAGTFDYVHMSSPINSKFDKVFLLRADLNKVISLK